MKKWKSTMAISLVVVAPAVSATPDVDDSFKIHGYAMAGSEFKGEANRPKSLSLHIDPTGPNQDPRGKLGDLGNTYWHDMFTTITLSKQWSNIYKEGQWADYNYEVVGYGDKGVETGQSYARMGGFDFLPENSHIWAGRRYNSDRVALFAYNIKEVNIDSGIGYVGDNFEISVGTDQIDWADERTVSQYEGSREVLDIEYRIGKAEVGLTYVKEIDNIEELFGKKQEATSVYIKYNLDTFIGLSSGSTMLQAQYGKGVIAQYLNTNRISSLSEEGDSAVRLTMDGNIASFDGFTINTAVIFEYTDREDSPTRTIYIPDNGYGGVGTYGDAEEVGLFGGINVHQKVTENVAMLYEANMNNTKNKDGNHGVDGTAYKLAMGPALQLKTVKWVAPIISLTVAYVGGDQELTFLDHDSEFRFGYRMEAWF